MDAFALSKMASRIVQAFDLDQELAKLTVDEKVAVLDTARDVLNNWGYFTAQSTAFSEEKAGG